MDKNKAKINNVPMTVEFFAKALKFDLHAINSLAVTLLSNPELIEAIAEKMFKQHELDELKKSIENPHPSPAARVLNEEQTK